MHLMDVRGPGSKPKVSRHGYPNSRMHRWAKLNDAWLPAHADSAPHRSSCESIHEPPARGNHNSDTDLNCGVLSTSQWMESSRQQTSSSAEMRWSIATDSLFSEASVIEIVNHLLHVLDDQVSCCAVVLADFRNVVMFVDTEVAGYGFGNRTK